MNKLILYFPEQRKNHKVISREIRVNKVFRGFIKRKSKDRRYLHFDFKTEKMYNILVPLLFETIRTLGYEAEEKVT